MLILLEVVGKTGEKTLLLEKLVAIEDATTHARLMMVEWNRMLKAVTMEHPEDIRLGPARPPFLDLWRHFFKGPKTALRAVNEA